jgi:hypothetical protein
MLLIRPVTLDRVLPTPFCQFRGNEVPILPMAGFRLSDRSSGVLSVPGSMLSCSAAPLQQRTKGALKQAYSVCLIAFLARNKRVAACGV